MRTHSWHVSIILSFNTKLRKPIILSPEMEGIWLASPDITQISHTSHQISLEAHMIDKSFITLGNSPEVIRPI